MSFLYLLCPGLRPAGLRLSTLLHLGCLFSRVLAGLALLLVRSVGQAQTLPAPVPGLPFWEWQAPKPTGLGLTDFYAFNDSSMVAVGGHGTAIKTGNGGRTWQVLPTGVDRALTAVSFANDLVGWMGTETAPTTARHYGTGVGRLLRTTDGGQSWVAQSIGEQTLSVQNPKVVAVSPTEAYVTYSLTGYQPAPNNTFIITPAPKMRHTTDGGQTWNLVTLPLGGSFDTNGTFSIPPLFTSATTGFIIAGFGTYQLLRTTDNGQSWQNVAPGTPSTFRPTQLTFLTAQRGWLMGIDAGGAAVLYQTVDGGQAWTLLTTLSFLSSSYAGPLSFATPTRGLLTDGPMNYETRDGGLSWTPTAEIPGTYFSRQTRLLPGGGGGWSVGSNGALYRTQDYGQSWRSRSSLPPVIRVTALGMPDPTHGWAIPQFFAPEHYTTLLRTRRRDEGWKPLSLEGVLPGLTWQQNAVLQGGAFPDADTVWVVGQEYDLAQQPIGLVLRTTDGGQSWQRQSLGGVSLPGGINEVGSWGTRRAVAVSNVGKALFVTRTGGAGWTSVPNPAPRRRPQRVTWADSATVYVTTDSAVFFKSTTAGRTWQVLPMPGFTRFFSTLYNFAFTSAQVGYLADGLGIWKTTNGGTSWQFADVSAQASTNSNSVQDPALTGLSFRTKQAGWAFGQTDVFQTQDGGQSWTKVAYVYGGGRGTLTAGPGVVIDQYNVMASGSGVVRYSEKFIQADPARVLPLAYAPGQSLSLAFATEGSLSLLPADYLVQVSNAMGRFRPGQTTTLVPTTASSSARLLTVTLPATLPTGTRYRVRVIAADSSVLGGDNDRDVRIEPVALTDLVVSTALALPGGDYRHVTITSTGTLTLSADLGVHGTLLVQDGGTLATSGSAGCAVVTGPGSFTLAAGGTLRICDPAGISASGPTGAIQLTGTRSFSPDASYAYTGTQPQVTGSGLPGQVRNLSVDNGTQGLTLSQGVNIAQVLRLSAGDLTTAGQPLTLLSGPLGTALIDNTGGLVLGTGTMQRYLDNQNPSGYRHYSAPVSNTTLADLGGTGYTPVVNPAYNTATDPGRVTPFPTLFAYDQDRLTTSPALGGSDFDKGWVVPPSLATAMEPGEGFTALAPNAALVDFTGTFTSGPVSRRNLTYGPQTEAGWQLLGNPYPSPLDWSTVTPAQRPNVGAAAYVFQSSGPYTGTYRTFVNGLGQQALIAAGSGYFVRTTAPGLSGEVTLTNANRVTAFGAQPAFGRGTADTRARLRLVVTGAGGTDETWLYLQAGATPGIDPEYDAPKLANSTGLNLASLSSPGSGPLAINGRPLLGSQEEVIPLSLDVPLAGSFRFEVAELADFGATTLYLADALTGTRQLLAPQTQYTVALPTAAAGQGRFSLVLRPAGVLATATALSAATVRLYPNPAHDRFHLALPPMPGVAQVPAILLNALGQTVRELWLPMTPRGSETELDVRSLPPGVYALRLVSGKQVYTHRVVLE